MKKRLFQFLQAVSDATPEVSFEIHLWDGERIRFGYDDPIFIMHLKTKRAAKRLLQSGMIGFGEEYTAGNICVEGDLQQLLRLGCGPQIQNLKLPFWMRLRLFWSSLTSLNTLHQSPYNIAYHYDRGNEFYQMWLDESMTYSCGYFRQAGDSLERAQQQKYEHICRKLQLQAGDTLVDLGCGWGGMLIYAAEHYGVKGVGCTLSDSQFQYATDKVFQAGLEDWISIQLEDYRQLSGRFDKFVSIGMFEHIGQKFIPLFMEKTRSLLKPGGIGLLQTIGKERPTLAEPWTMTHIFPGAYLPTLDEIVRAMGRISLVPVDVENLRPHYAKTLDQWSERFELHAEEIESLFDASFVRMWRLFLKISAVGFRYGNTRLYQITFTNGLNHSLPLTREHLYTPTYEWMIQQR